MFKFMKSKKGFSLVELMIVVVIMAILVAVAVPIYNAVTANARKKTCVDNQRTLVNTISNEIMLKGYTVANGATTGESIVITTNATGDGGTAVADGGNTAITQSRFNSLFQTVPYCPSEEISDGVGVTVTVTIKQVDGIASVTTVCSAGHKLNEAQS